MLTLEHYNSNEYIKKVFIKNKKFFNEEGFCSIDEVIESEEKRNRFFFVMINEIYSIYRSEKQKTTALRKIDFSGLNLEIEDKLIYKILLSNKEYLDFEYLNHLSQAFPYISLTNSIKETAWQWFCENKIQSNILEEIFNVLTSLKKPFDDERFSSFPVSVACYQAGIITSPWLNEKQGGFSKYVDNNNKVYMERNKTLNRTLFLDAKVGIVIYFKDKPSITIGFNFDSNKNIYIHQIQAQHKDRGHYKLKDWRKDSLDYIKSLFPDFKIHLISGKDIVEQVMKGYNYTPNLPKDFYPTKEKLNSIESLYDNMFQVKKVVQKSQLKYYLVA